LRLAGPPPAGGNAPDTDTARQQLADVDPHRHDDRALPGRPRQLAPAAAHPWPRPAPPPPPPPPPPPARRSRPQSPHSPASTPFGTAAAVQLPPAPHGRPSAAPARAAPRRVRAY